MIETSLSRVKISEVVQSQIPEHIATDNPLFADFLKQYYISQEHQGGAVDLAENLVDYKSLEYLNSSNLVGFTSLTEYVDGRADTITVDSTTGFPSKWGLLKINNEIMTYTGIAGSTFTGVVRGFSGVERDPSNNQSEFLTFNSTGIGTHGARARVKNLSSVFLNEFLTKIKSLVLPGFENRNLHPELNQPNFIRQAKNFYQSKGTPEAFEILFRVLFNQDVEVVQPIKYVIKPSDADYVVNTVLVAQKTNGGDVNAIVGETLFQGDASASIYSIEEVVLHGEYYYKLKLSLQEFETAKFQQNEKSFVTRPVGVGATFVNVDSTVGFDDQGILTIGHRNYSYDSKTYTQFRDIQPLQSGAGIGSTVFSGNVAYAFEGGDTTKRVDFNIVGLIDRFECDDPGFEKGTEVSVKSIGKEDKSPRVTSWITNVASKHNIKSKKNLGANIFDIEFDKDHSFCIGDQLDLVGITTELNTNNGEVSAISNGRRIRASLPAHNENNDYFIRKSIVNSIQEYPAEIENTYIDAQDNLYVASQSLPRWQIEASTRIREFNNQGYTNNSERTTISIDSHGFVKGDKVIYRPKVLGQSLSGLNTGQAYYVDPRDSVVIRLALTKENIRLGEYVNIIGEEQDYQAAGIKVFNLVPAELDDVQIMGQNLLKRFPVPKFGPSKTPTQEGSIGLLSNGVLINSYKTSDKVSYGQIQSVRVLNSGDNYDVINPPRLEVINQVGTGASFTTHVSGSIKEILVDNPGLDYEEDPSVRIVGGNGQAFAKAKMKLQEHEILFDSSTISGQVDPSLNQIKFKNAHGFKNLEEVSYNSNGTTAIGIATSPGKLVDKEIYFVIKIDDYTIALADNLQDAISSKRIVFETNGQGFHTLKTKNRRLKVDKIQVITNGVFSNRLNQVGVAGINEYVNRVQIKDHGYSTGEEIIYDSTDTAINGLTKGSVYYVDRISSDEFSLSNSKTGSPAISFGDVGVGTHSFKYRPVEVIISGRQGIQTSNATATAVIRGQITGCNVIEPGTNYGSQVLNDDFVPTVRPLDGKGAQLRPFVVNGKIEEIIVKDGGRDFFQRPDIIIGGRGRSAKAIATVENGSIVKVTMVAKGIGYSQETTTVDTDNPGSGAILYPELQTWNLDQVFRVLSAFGSPGDDAFVGKQIRPRYKNPYVCFFAPKKLLEVKGQVEGQHSPIIGWAYDGNPIYGPFGYTNPDGTGGIKVMQSGWKLTTANSRVNGPSFTSFPPGSFIEDYKFETNVGDLDRHNGRFCITPEFPNGVYAYFTSVQKNIIQNSLDPFNGTRKPTFPYVVGPEYNMEPDSFNFEILRDQSTDLEELGAVRNVTAHNISDYEFVGRAYRNVSQIARIVDVTEGPVQNIRVLEPGSDYMMKDKVVFNNDKTGGFGAIASIKNIDGPGISRIEVNTVKVDNIKFSIKEGTVTGITTLPHGLEDRTNLTVLGISSDKYSAIEGKHTIRVVSKTGIAATSLLATGLTTSLPLTTNVNKFNVGEFVKIDDEQMKIFRVDEVKNRIDVVRRQNGTAGAAHTNRAEVKVLPNKFTFETEEVLDFALPEENTVFFDASKDVGVGLTAGVGIGTTVAQTDKFGNPRDIFIPTKTIYMPNHGFENNQKVKYDNGGGISLPYSEDGVIELAMPSEVYIKNLGPNFIGIVTTTAGINSLSDNVFFNANIGIGNTHSFTEVKNTLRGSIESEYVNVFCSDVHRLQKLDNIDLNLVSYASSEVNAAYNGETSFLEIEGSPNPLIRVERGQTLVFDATDFSMNDKDIKFYRDQNFTKQFVGSGISAFEVTTEGIFGDTGKISIKFTENTPSPVFYKIDSRSDQVPTNVDETVPGYGKIVVVDTTLNSGHFITSVTNASSFLFTSNKFVERRVFDSDEYLMNYTTTSNNAKGGIGDILLKDGGREYSKRPPVTISSKTGDGAVVVSTGNEIGKINKLNILEYGYDYPSDRTLQPQAKTSQHIIISDNFKIKSVGVTSTGRNYLTKPEIRLVNARDYKTADVTIEPVMSNDSIIDVKVVDAGRGLRSDDLKLYTINNSNGVGIVSATYSDPTVTLRLQTPPTGYSTAFPLPFAVGDEVFVERITTGFSTDNGYNSEDYNYRTFTLTGVNTAFGLVDQATITYELDVEPGNHDGQQFGHVAKYNDLARFNVTLEENEFFDNEVIKTKTSEAQMLRGVKNPTNYLRVDSVVGFKTGDIITGNTSRSRGTIRYLESTSGTFNIKTSIKDPLGWQRDTGKLNDSLQRIQDSDYYQAFAYSLKSQVGMSSWTEPVSSLAHIAGFKKHSDLLIPSTGAQGINTVGVGTAGNIILLDREVRFADKSDWDMGFEITNPQATLSNEIVFNSKRFGTSLECKSNRVLDIDDISPQFYSDPEFDRITTVDEFDLSDAVAVKYHAQIIVDPDEMLINDNENSYSEMIVVHNGEDVFINQYSDIFQSFRLGTFSGLQNVNEWRLSFKPFNSSLKYDLTFYKEIIPLSVGVGTTTLDTFTKVGVASFIDNPLTADPHTIIEFDQSKFKSGHVIVVGYSTNSVSSLEAGFLSIGDTAQFIPYGEIDGPGGIGTFGMDADSTVTKMQWYPVVGTGVTVAMLASLVGFGTTNPDVQEVEVGDAVLSGTITTITSGAASQTTIAEYAKTQFSSVKYFVEIENTTTGHISFFQVGTVDYLTDTAYNKWSLVSTATTESRDFDNTIFDTSGQTAELKFLPESGNSYLIRTGEHKISVYDGQPEDDEIDLL